MGQERPVRQRLTAKTPMEITCSQPRSTVYGHLDKATTVPRQPKKTRAAG
jgi:hypothetical protein